VPWSILLFSKNILYHKLAYQQQQQQPQQQQPQLSNRISSLFYLSQVSWIRKKDLHILTSENFVFSGDQRFAVLHHIDTSEWNLQIEHATMRDSGTYECQVNTEPKIKLSVNLEVTGEWTLKFN